MRQLFVGLIVFALVGAGVLFLPSDHSPVALCNKLKPGVSGSQLAAEFGPSTGTSLDKGTGKKWTLYPSCDECSGPIRAVINDHGLVTELSCSVDAGTLWKM